MPGPYNPITDLYDVEAKDAHAWVQVWFPGYGWQNFDPTADVPLANPTPGSVLATSIGARLGRPAVDPHRPGRRPWRPSWSWCAAGGPAARPPGPTRWRPTWPGAVPGSGVPRRRDETLIAYGAAAGRGRARVRRRDRRRPRPLVERCAYGGVEPIGRADRRRPGRHPPVPVGATGAGGGPVRRDGRPAAGRRPSGRGVGQRLVERGAGGQQRAGSP